MNGEELGFRAYGAWGIGCVSVYNSRQCRIKRKSLWKIEWELGYVGDCKYLDLRN